MVILDIHIIMVIFVYVFLAYVFKFLWREDFQQIPGLVETVENGPYVIRALRDKFPFKSFEKFQV